MKLERSGLTLHIHCAYGVCGGGGGGGIECGVPIAEWSSQNTVQGCGMEGRREGGWEG